MDRLAAEDIWTKWGADLLAYASMLVGPDEAADVVQEVMARLVATEDGAGLTRPYLFRSVLNEVRMQHRAKTRRERREWKASEPRSEHEFLSDPDVIAAIGRLSPMQRAVVFLTYWDDLTVEAVADVLQIAPGTVKAHLARARASLRRVLA